MRIAKGRIENGEVFHSKNFKEAVSSPLYGEKFFLTD